MVFKLFSIPLLCMCLLCMCCRATADARRSVIADTGDFEFFAEGGAAKLDRDWTWLADAGLRIGLPHGIEVALPAALSYAPIRKTPLEIVFTLGITDFWPVDKTHFLYTPSSMVVMNSRLNHEARGFLSLDYTHVQYNFQKSPGYFRSAGALMVNMGPYLTWCIGISYQRLVVDRPEPSELNHSGFAGKQRISLGSVRVTPFNDAPLFLIHATAHLDFSISVRFDIDADTHTTNARVEGGVSIFR